VLCDVCGRNNADNLTFCQDCGRRLRQQRGVAPTPPNGMPRVEAPPRAAPAPAAAADAAPDSNRGSSPSGPPSAGRRARPAAPVFSFSTVEPVAEPPRAAPPPLPAAAAPAAEKRPAQVCSECRSQNPPEYRFCVTCGAPLRRAAEGHAPPVAPVPPVALARPEPRRDPARDPPPPPPSLPDDEKIIGAPVVDIASSGAVPARIVTCTRCRGHCVAGTRFCKYCGAPLDEFPARRAEPPPDPVAVGFDKAANQVVSVFSEKSS